MLKHLPELIAETRRDVAEGDLTRKAEEYAVLLELANIGHSHELDVRDLAADRYAVLVQIPARMRSDDIREEMTGARLVMAGYHLGAKDEGQK